MIHKRKSVLRVIFGIMAAIAFVFACLLGDLIYATRFKINPVDKSTSPDGTYELSFQQVGDPDWPFGYTHARLVLKNGKRVIIKQTFDIADDGAKATINSWNVDWCILRRRVAAGALRVATRRYEWPALIRLLYVQS